MPSQYDQWKLQEPDYCKPPDVDVVTCRDCVHRRPQGINRHVCTAAYPWPVDVDLDGKVCGDFAVPVKGNLDHLRFLAYARTPEVPQ